MPPPLGPLTVPTTFQVDDVTIPVGFDSNADFATFIGSFGLGTIIAPLAVNIETGNNGNITVTAFDTSWTNAALVNDLAVTSVPEPRTWLMGLIGFAALGLVSWKRKIRLA